LSRILGSPAKVNAGEEQASRHSYSSGTSEPPNPTGPVSEQGPSRQSGGSGPLLSLRSAVILGESALIAACAGELAYLMAASLPAAFLAAGPTFAGSVTLLNAIIG